MIEVMGGAYLDGRDPKETPLASPLYAELHGLPPALVLVGSNESLYDDSTRAVEKIRAANGSVEFFVGEGMTHIWPIFPFLPEALEATDRIGAFMRSIRKK
jgi:monoterpene epsilon-lactone hydrolase